MNNILTQNKSLGVLVTVAAYLLALLAAIWSARLLPPSNPLLVIAVADLAATLVIFFFSVAFNNSSMYDPYWSVKPAVIAAYYMLLYGSEGTGTRQLLVFSLVMLYAVRLTSNFYRDWPGLSHEDWRYANFRIRFPKVYWLVSLAGIHLFPTVMVYLGCLPLAGAMQAEGVPLNLLDVVATLVTLGAVALAFTADEQLRLFRKNPANRGEVIRTGLWRSSRHPNYLGEILTWWGMYLFALASGLNWWWTGAGALAITLMFLLVSIPLMEERALASRQGYAAYMKQAHMLLPLRRRA
jgi:steroid 5-alpha reductase family enzyme